MTKILFKPLAAAAVLLLAGTAALAQRDLSVVSWGGAYQDGQKEVFSSPSSPPAPSCWTRLGRRPGCLAHQDQGRQQPLGRGAGGGRRAGSGLRRGPVREARRRQDRGAARYLPGTVHALRRGRDHLQPVLAYDGDKTKTAPAGWADFFDAKKFPGKRAIRNGAKWNLEVALIADGVPAKDVYKTLRTPDGIERAFKKLDTIKADLVFWKSGAQPPQMLAAGDVVFTTAYNGRITAANEKDRRTSRWSGRTRPTRWTAGST